MYLPKHFAEERPEVLRRYAEQGAELRMSGHEGALRLHVDPETGAGPVQAWREAGARGWWAPPLREFDSAPR